MSIQDDYFDTLAGLSKQDKPAFERFAKWAFELETIGELNRGKIEDLECTIKTIARLSGSQITMGYKLLRLRKNGSLGSLFINRKAILPLNNWLVAEPHRAKGYNYRPGFHVLEKPVAPHLNTNGRVWARVAIQDFSKHKRPDSQGGWWLLAQKMIILELLC